MKIATTFAVLAFAAGTASCGSKGAVSLSAEVRDPSLALQSGALATVATGGFDLRLSLGGESPDATDVSLGSFTLVSASDQSMLVKLLVDTATAFPVHLEPGGAATVHFAFADEQGGAGQTLDAPTATAICAVASAVEISGSVSDTAQGHATPLVTGAFAASGCP